MELLEKTYEKLRVSADQPAENGDGTEFDSSHYLKIVSAFDMPPWRWNEENKAFEKYVSTLNKLARASLIGCWFSRQAKSASLAPPATAKSKYLRDRFNIIKQVILRNEHFCPPAVAGQERTDYMKVFLFAHSRPGARDTDAVAIS